MKGLANIPILIAFALIIAITPLAIKQVQQNQNLQNRAAPELTYVGKIPCSDLFNAKNTYCQGSVNTNPSSVPCADITSAIYTYCSSALPKITAYPTTKPIGPTLIPKITSYPTPIPKISATPACVNGQTKCVGRIVMKCTNSRWLYQQVCSGQCLGGRCIISVPKIPNPIR